jgi:WYL domain
LALQGVRTYLVCQFEDYSNQRILALHRMKSVKNLGIPFVRPKFDLEEYDGEGHFGIGEGQFVKLTFCITKGAGKHILESPLSKDQVVEEMDDHYQITATVVETKLLERWLFGFGKDVWGVVKSK